MVKCVKFVMDENDDGFTKRAWGYFKDKVNK